MAVDMTNNSSDVFINVGAKADMGGAAEKAMAEFAKMEAKLKTIGTKEAQELARQISAVTKGLGKGTVDPKEVEALTLAFASVQKASELSDKAIADLSAKMSNAVSNSRALSDHMRKVEDSTKKSNDAGKGLSDAIDDLSPSAKRVTDEMGKWARRIPGVGKLIDGIAAKIPGIGIGFKIATAAIVEGAKALRGFNEDIKNAKIRAMSIEEENDHNEKANALADLDRVTQKRQSELADKKAAMLAQRELDKITAEATVYDINQTEAYSKQREMNVRKNEREQAYQDLNTQSDILDKDITENDEQKKDLEKKIEIYQKAMEADAERLEQYRKFVKEYEALRSEQAAAAERYEKTGGAEDMGFLDKINEKMKNATKDMVKDLKAWGLGDADTMTAEEKFKAYSDKVRAEVQKRIEAERTIKALRDSVAATERKGEALQSAKTRNTDEVSRLAKKNAFEDAQFELERNQRIAGQRVEAMGSKNRLTAMGLGSGNAGADAMKDTAQNTHELLGVAKDIHRFLSSGTQALSLGAHAPTETGYKAASWAL